MMGRHIHVPHGTSDSIRGSVGDKHGLVFKGGTALRLCYFEDYRYSADLDFSVVEGDLNACL